MIIEIPIDVLPDRYSDDLKIYDETNDITQMAHYNRMLKFKEDGEEFWKDLAKRDIEKITYKFMDLYKSIKNRGFQDAPHPIISVTKTGVWKVKGGYHRISILKHLGYKTVKVRVDMHPKFKKFYDTVYKLYNKDRTYQYIDHVVFSNSSVVRGSNRPELIANELVGKTLNVLEVGSYLGHTSLEIAKCGHTVVGLELDHKLTKCSQFLGRYYKHKYPDIVVKFEQGDVIEHFKTKRSYDVVIMMSVDRWIVKHHGEKVLENLFKQIYKSSKYFFFESRGHHETFAISILDKLYKQKKKIGVDDGETKRNLWKFTK